MSVRVCGGEGTRVDGVTKQRAGRRRQPKTKVDKYMERINQGERKCKRYKRSKGRGYR